MVVLLLLLLEGGEGSFWFCNDQLPNIRSNALGSVWPEAESEADGEGDDTWVAGEELGVGVTVGLTESNIRVDGADEGEEREE